MPMEAGLSDDIALGNFWSVFNIPSNKSNDSYNDYD